jgi:hypothetical protein
VLSRLLVTSSMTTKRCVQLIWFPQTADTAQLLHPTSGPISQVGLSFFAGPSFTG